MRTQEENTQRELDHAFWWIVVSCNGGKGLDAYEMDCFCSPFDICALVMLPLLGFCTQFKFAPSPHPP
jgi:hypothetical protein